MQYSDVEWKSSNKEVNAKNLHYSHGEETNSKAEGYMKTAIMLKKREYFP